MGPTTRKIVAHQKIHIQLQRKTLRLGPKSGGKPPHSKLSVAAIFAAPASPPALLIFSTASLEIDSRQDSAECGPAGRQGLLPLSTPGRALPYQYPVGAQHAAPAVALSSFQRVAETRFS
jgi:hypothetical protein